MSAKKSAATAKNSSAVAPKPTEITRQLLRKLSLPQPRAEGSKEDRGRVVIVGGSPGLMGAATLAGTGALRAGAGKLQIAVGRSIAPFVGLAVPEALVVSCAETSKGCFAASAHAQIMNLAERAQAVLIGPGLVPSPMIVRLTAEIAKKTRAVLVLDAGALDSIVGRELQFHGRAIVTPHAGEMAKLRGQSRLSIEANQIQTAIDHAKISGAVTVLKGRHTIIASPTGELYVNKRGNVGLATSGSGDALAGIIAGLAARGATPVQAAVWGVHLHALAGERLAKMRGPLGFLAREILEEVPGLMAGLAD